MSTPQINITVMTFKTKQGFDMVWRRQQPDGSYTEWSERTGPYPTRRNARDMGRAARDRAR